MSLKRPRTVPKFICEKCGSTNVTYLKEDFYECQDCSHSFKIHWGLSFGKELFSQYNLVKDYDNFMRTKYIRSFLDLNRNDVFLDAGCSLGFFTLWAATIVKEAIGIDIERWRLRSARAMKEKMKIERAHFTSATIYDIPYPDNFFDKVLCAEVLEHLAQPYKAIHELARVCKKALVIQVPTTSFIKSLGEKIFGLTDNELESVKESEGKSLPHVQRFTAKSILNLIESCGFVVTKLVGTKSIPLHTITDNSFLIYCEWFCDLILGSIFTANMLGGMTIIRSEKRGRSR